MATLRTKYEMRGFFYGLGSIRRTGSNARFTEHLKVVDIVPDITDFIP